MNVEYDLTRMTKWLKLLKEAEAKEYTFKDEENRIDQILDMNEAIDRATDISTWYEPDCQKEYFVIPLLKWKLLCENL